MLGWSALPEQLHNDKVKPYYDSLQQKKGAIILKRIFDFVVALILLIILSPVFLLLAVWIKLDSPGPIFFRQERVTRYGKVFRIFKFRTMVNDADQNGTQVTVQNDSRITKVGMKIRKVRLDELPQLINIVMGDMSFVGTRPEVPKYVAAYSEEMYATLLLPAGVTSKASIEFKDEDTLLEVANDVDQIYIEEILPLKMQYNLEDIRDFSCIRDIQIMIRTVIAVLR